jgi:hypothetical protein
MIPERERERESMVERDTKKTNPIHKDVPENTTFLLLDQPSGDANTTGTNQ